MVEQPHHQPALSQTPQQQIRSRLDAERQRTTKAGYEHIAKRANEIAVMPHPALYAHVREQSMLQLQRFHTAAEANRKELEPHMPNLRRTSEWSTQIEPMVQAITATPPRVPGAPGSAARRSVEVGEPVVTLGRYLSVSHEAIRGDGDDIRLVTISVKAQIFQDIETVQTLLSIYEPRPPEHQGDGEITAALRILKNRLSTFAQIDVRTYAAYEQSQRQGYMNEAFGQMGKLLAVAGLTAYALADGVISLANGRMPIVGSIAGLGAVLIADRRLRRRIFGPADIARLETMDAVLAGLKPYAKDYQLYGLDGAWVPVLQRFMDDRTYISDEFTRISAIRDPERVEKETANFVNALSPNAEVRKHLVSMMNTRTAAGVTHCEGLFSVFHNIGDDETQTVIMQMIRMRAGQRPGQSQTPPAAPAPRPAGPGGGTRIV